MVIVAPRLPGPGETVLGPRLERHGGGKGANAAVAAARLGADVQLVAAVGDDPLGGEALGELRREGVGVDWVATAPGEATGAALIVVDPAGENQIAVGLGANAALGADHVSRALRAIGHRAGCVLISLEIPDEPVRVAVTAGAEHGAAVVVNPAPARASVLKLAAFGPILTPNAGEAIALSGAGDARGAAAALAARTGAAVVVTTGAEGALVLDAPAAEVLAVPAPVGIAVVDTTGAGDTFSGALATRIAAGEPIHAAARFAVAASACAVRASGARTAMPPQDDVRALLER